MELSIVIVPCVYRLLTFTTSKKWRTALYSLVIITREYAAGYL